MSDPYFDNVTLLLHCDGSDGSTTFTDATGKTVTAYNDAHIETDQSQFGGASGRFSNASTQDYCTVPSSSDFDFGTGEFTVEFWINPDNVSTFQGIFDTRSSASDSGWFIYLNAASVKFFTSNADRCGASTSLSAGQWTHVALVRKSNTKPQLFIGGVAQGEGTAYASAITCPGDMFVGRYATTTVNRLKGYLDEIRVTKGVARYTADFTPPTEAFYDASSITYTKSVTSGAHLGKTYTKSVSCGAQIGDVLSTVRTAYAGALLAKSSSLKTTLIGAALKSTLLKSPDAGACLGSILTKTVFASAAELGLQKKITVSSDFLYGSLEVVYPETLVQKALYAYCFGNSYVTRTGLTKSVTASAFAADLRRCYANSAIKGTATKYSLASSVIKSAETISVSASSVVSLEDIENTPAANSYIQKPTLATFLSGAYVAKQRARTIDAGAAIGEITDLSSLSGAVLAKTRTKTATSGSVVSKVMTKTPLVSAALYAAGITKTVVAGAYLVADAGTETLVRADCEWTAQPRQVEWMAATRETEWLVDARPVEWIASGCGESPQWAVTVRTACQAGAYLAAA